MKPNCLALSIFLLLSLIAGNKVLAQNNSIELLLDENEREWLKQHQSIRIAFDGYFPPYSFINEQGNLEGIAVDILSVLEKKTGIEFEIFEEKTWKNLYHAAQNKEVDLVATMVHKRERETWFNFTHPYLLKSLVIITQEENRTINHRNDLPGKNVALVKGYQYVNTVLQKYPDIKPLYFDTMLDALNAVSTGKADAAITFLGAGHYLRTKYLLSNLKYAAVFDRNNSPESIAVRNDWPELVSILNKAIQSLPESDLHTFNSTWLPENYKEILTEVTLSEEEQRWLAEHPEIRLGVDPEFAPFEFIDNRRYQGMASDYVRLLNQRLNIDMKVVPNLSWDEVIQKAKAGEIDVLPAVGKTDERQTYLNFTEPYLQFHRVIVTRNDSSFILDLQDLKTLKVGVQKDSSHHGFLLEHSDIQAQTFDSLEASLMALSGGHIDAFVGNVASTSYWIRKRNLSNLKIAAPVSTDLEGLHFAIKKEWGLFSNILQKGLNSISDRERQEISEKWLNIQYDPKTDYRLFWKSVALFSTVLGFILLWNYLLNRKVKRRTAELLFYAHYDQLTELPNRFLIQDRLGHLIEEAKKSNSTLAMLSIDIDDFKKVNDTFGHGVGDNVIKQVASNLKNVFKDNYLLGHLGGDQFLAILSPLEEASEAAVIANSILKSLESNITVENQDIAITASLGIAIFPGDGDSPDVLLKNADSATHHSKKHGHGTYAFYTENINQNVARALRIEELMRNALRNNEFYMVYQPKIKASTRKIIGFEALLRWNNADLGEVYPDEFIPIAEKNGLIIPIGFFVLQNSLEALAHFQRNFDTSLTMAVNFSPRQFRSEHLIHQILTALQRTGVDNRSLELEITEGVLISGHPNVDITMGNLKSLGVTLAMDDFGKGYSSMSYLRRYTFNVLKIDREFINELAHNRADRQLVYAAIAMAHNLDMKVVAEGVETEEQYAILNDCHCDFMQGWLFSKALTEADVCKLLSNYYAKPFITKLSAQGGGHRDRH